MGPGNILSWCSFRSTARDLPVVCVHYFPQRRVKGVFSDQVGEPESVHLGTHYVIEDIGEHQSDPLLLQHIVDRAQGCRSGKIYISYG